MKLRWEKANPEKVISYVRKAVKKWFSKHPEKHYEYQRNHEARKKSNGGNITTQEWRELCAKYGNKCLSCGLVTKLELDHVIPLALGGTNTIDNAQPLCRSCNARKGARYIDYR